MDIHLLDEFSKEERIHIRYLKIMFAVIAAIMCLAYAMQNLANTNAAHQAIMYVISGADHKIYTETFAFYFTSPTIGWVAVILIFGFEIMAGFLLLKGAYEMWKARNSDANTFKTSKKWAEIGAGIGVLVWFGFFGVIGAGFFQMWQTQAGVSSLAGAFQYFASCAFTLLYLNQDDK